MDGDSFVTKEMVGRRKHKNAMTGSCPSTEEVSMYKCSKPYQKVSCVPSRKQKK
jgi:hypothetical protein